MSINLTVNQACFKTYQKNYGRDEIFACDHPILNKVFTSLFILYSSAHLLKGIRNNWFKDPETEKTVIAKWSVSIHIYKLENDSFVKLTKLNYPTLYPSNFERQKVPLIMNVFKE